MTLKTIQVWIVADVSGGLGTMDKPDFRAINYDPTAWADYNVVAGPIDVPFDLPTGWNPKQKELDRLKSAAARQEEEAKAKAELLQRRIQELSK